MPPSRVHRTRPLLSPTDLPLARSRPPRPRPSAWRTMPRHVEARHAALCSHLQGLHILDRVEHLIGNKSHRGDSNGRPNRTAPGAVPRQQCTSYGSNALVAKALHCLLSSAMLRQIVHCPRATSSRAARSARRLFGKPPIPLINVDAPITRKTVQSGTRPGRPLAQTKPSQN